MYTQTNGAWISLRCQNLYVAHTISKDSIPESGKLRKVECENILRMDILLLDFKIIQAHYYFLSVPYIAKSVLEKVNTNSVIYI